MEVKVRAITRAFRAIQEIADRELEYDLSYKVSRVLFVLRREAEIAEVAIKAVGREHTEMVSEDGKEEEKITRPSAYDEALDAVLEQVTDVVFKYPLEPDWFGKKFKWKGSWVDSLRAVGAIKVEPESELEKPPEDDTEDDE